MKADDGLLLPILQQEVAGNPAVVLVHLPVAFPPVVEFTGSDVEPPNEPPAADLGLLRPAPDGNPRSDPVYRAEPSARSEFPNFFF